MYWRHYFLAQSFLSRLPVPKLGELSAADFAQAALYYPVVGLLIGVLLCVPIWLLPHANPLLLAALIISLWAAITGGLHLDGLADSADAWLGGLGDREKTHRILKDPLTGAAGVIAICCLLLLKFAALHSVLQQGHWLAVLIAPVLGRSLILLLFLTTPYVRAQGLASDVTTHLPRRAAWVIVGLLFTLSLVFFPLASLTVLGVFWLLRRLMLQRLQGCTGDTAGASVEVGEMSYLFGYALV